MRRRFTREAGVRSLEREISAVCPLNPVSRRSSPTVLATGNSMVGQCLASTTSASAVPSSLSTCLHDQLSRPFGYSVRVRVRCP
ncbi:MAG: hypothetical protein ACOY0T_03690 [Myxococcota bacterium]